MGKKWEKRKLLVSFFSILYYICILHFAPYGAHLKQTSL